MFVDFNILNQLGSPSINSNTFANRPSAGQVGRLFVSTDTFEIYRDTGTGWDLIGGPGSSTVTGSGAAGQVTYWTGSNSVSGENALWWDAANNHLGINTITPGAALDIHSAADVGMQLNGTGATPNIYIDFLQTGTSQYRLGYTDGAIDDRRFSIYDVTGAKEVLTIDKQSRYVGINFQYSSLTDQPQYMLDLSGGSFHTNTGQYLVGTPTDLTRSFAASGNANSIAVWLEEYGNTTASADIFFIKGRGTDTAKLNVQVGDSLGGFAFTGYLNSQYNQSVIIGTTVTNLDTTNNQANSDFTIQQSYNSAGLTENFRIIANGGNAYLRGKLGIGTLTPDRILTVYSGTADSRVLLQTQASGTGIASGFDLNIIYSAYGAYAQNDAQVWNYENAALVFATNNTERARFDNTGVFAINETAPYAGAKLIVKQATSFDGLYVNNSTSANNSISLYHTGSVGAIDVTYLGSGSYTPLTFWTNGLERIRVNTNGNTLIGTTTDNGSKLQVNGYLTLNGGIKLFDFITPSTNFWETYHYNDNTYRMNYNGAGNDELILSNTGVLTVLASYKSGAPNGGTAANWKFGTRVAAAVVLDATQYIELDVNGTLYKLAIVT